MAASWRYVGWCANAYTPVLPGVRIDDQPIEGKRRTQSAGISVVPIEQAIARYRAAVDMKNEIDPNFVVMAQCYARDADNSDFDDTLRRLKAYKEDAGVDWVQLESPHSVEEIKQARAAVMGPFSFMKGKLPLICRSTSTSHSASTSPGFPASPITSFGRHFRISCRISMRAVSPPGRTSSRAAGTSRIPSRIVGDDGEGAAKQRALELRYFGRQ